MITVPGVYMIQRVTLSRHWTETLKPKTLQSILDQAGLTIDEFRELL